MLGSRDLPSMLEPRGLYRTDGKRLDGVIMMPWEIVKQLVWDATAVNERLFLCHPGTNAEARKNEKYCKLLDNGYNFQSWPWKYRFLEARALEFLSRVSVNLQAGSSLKQLISMALHIGNAACVLGNVNDGEAFGEI